VNKAAQSLGKLAKGKPKTLSAAERERRRHRLIKLNKTRPGRSEQARKAVAARWEKHRKVLAARALFRRKAKE
jgi:hypothetical protein